MRYLLFTLTAIFVCACTDYQGDWEDKWGNKFVAAPSGGDVFEHYDSADDMPSCTVKKEGELTQVGEDEGYTVCHNKRWIYNISVKETEDDIPVCVEKRQDVSIYLSETKTLVTCDGTKWVDENEEDGENEED